MFDELRDARRQGSPRLDPDERRRMGRGMREAMVHAKLAIQAMRAALATTETRLQAEQGELDTVRRRQGLAAQIDDAETVAIAERFAAQHAERVAMLESKRMVQQQELDLAEREYEGMSAELTRVLSGFAPDPSSPEAAAAREVDALLSDDPAAAGVDLPPPPARRSRAERTADAEARLAALKQQLGK
jgi:multidrug resistance efflux pump